MLSSVYSGKLREAAYGVCHHQYGCLFRERIGTRIRENFFVRFFARMFVFPGYVEELGLSAPVVSTDKVLDHFRQIMLAYQF